MNINKSTKITGLKQKIEHEHSEEYRHVEMFRPLVQEVEELSKSFLSSILNSGKIKRLNKKMQGYADIANHHQRRKNEFRKELCELEKAN